MTEPNWWNFRFEGKQPERRGYHSSFINNGTLYLFGGKDISVGHFNNLWALDIGEIGALRHGTSESLPNPEWRLIKTMGQKVPLPISNHTSVVYNNKMFLFGGGGGMCENKEMYVLDLETYRWTVLKPLIQNHDASNDPVTRDEHSCIVYDDSMIVFGGFSVGEKTNTIFKYHFKYNTWEQIKAKGKVRPCPRVGHSAVLYHDDNKGDCMYIFGGKDEENNKLSDIWKFNFETL